MAFLIKLIVVVGLSIWIYLSFGGFGILFAFAAIFWLFLSSSGGGSSSRNRSDLDSGSYLEEEREE